MVQHRLLSAQMASVAAAMLGIAFIVPAAHADDPLAPIIRTVQKDRNNACVHYDPRSGPTFGSDKDFRYDKRLEAVAQAYARDEKIPNPPQGFRNILPFLGAGDPESQAINRAYQHGAGKAIGDCSLEHAFYGVGFVRHNNRSVDVVTIVIGFLNPPPPPQPPNEHCRSLGADWMNHAECKPPPIK